MAENATNVPNVPSVPKTVKQTSIFIYIIWGLIALMIVVVSAGAILIINNSKTTTIVQPTNTHNNSHNHNGNEPNDFDFGETLSLGNEFLVNLATSDEGEENLIRAIITLELYIYEKDKHKEEEIKSLQKRIPQMRDGVYSVLRAKTKEEINKKEGKESLRSEIMEKINHLLREDKVKDVYFEDFVIQ